MDRPKALVTAPFRGEGLRQLEELAEVVLDPWIDHRPMRIYGPEQLVERLEETGADILICEADFCSGPVFDLPLRVIGSTRGDPTNVDVPGATAKGIPVLKAPGRNADGVAEMTVALLFATSRHVLPADADVRALEVFRDGTVPYQRFRAWEVNGRTAGLVGLGAIGRALRWRLQGLGMEVLAYDPYSDEAKESLDEVLERSDVISMHAAVTPETLGLINAERIASMKDGVIYLNAARAALHDMDALVAGLQSGKIGGAGLDHFEGEQLPEGSPLLSMTNV
ncbi:MAG: D-3-phosphoglycerate dehydrogenase / 2-oxoglutarate reductase, partial [Actinomycetota bacterium]|nr:D-3-phosphoglycerate dehydrogenase / 2-oxoglutarate reductase [Actinomycetota bacterium]